MEISSFKENTDSLPTHITYDSVLSRQSETWWYYHKMIQKKLGPSQDLTSLLAWTHTHEDGLVAIFQTEVYKSGRHYIWVYSSTYWHSSMIHIRSNVVYRLYYMICQYLQHTLLHPSPFSLLLFYSVGSNFILYSSLTCEFNLDINVTSWIKKIFFLFIYDFFFI